MCPWTTYVDSPSVYTCCTSKCKIESKLQLELQWSVGGLDHDHIDIAAISIACSHQLYDVKVEVV